VIQKTDLFSLFLGKSLLSRFSSTVNSFNLLARLGEIEKTDLLSFFGILSFLGFLREPQSFIHLLLTDLSDCLLFFIALSSFLRVQV